MCQRQGRWATDAEAASSWLHSRNIHPCGQPFCHSRLPILRATSMSIPLILERMSSLVMWSIRKTPSIGSIACWETLNWWTSPTVSDLVDAPFEDLNLQAQIRYKVYSLTTSRAALPQYAGYMMLITKLFKIWYCGFAGVLGYAC